MVTNLHGPQRPKSRCGQLFSFGDVLKIAQRRSKLLNMTPIFVTTVFTASLSEKYKYVFKLRTVHRHGNGRSCAHVLAVVLVGY